MTTTLDTAKKSSGTFGAPWGRAVKVITVLISVLMVAVSSIIFTLVNFPTALKFIVVAAPILVVVGVLPFRVLSFEIGEREMLVRRPGWTTRIPLDGLLSVEKDPAAVTHALRLFGNGGVFAFNGVFWSKRLGRFRAYVTDLNRSVVMKLPDRIVVVSPDVPEDFIAELRNRGFLAR